MVSVIIPVYNRAETIKKSIMSVLNQSYFNLELIVIDDCSTDNTLDKIKEIKDSRLIILKHDKNKGACEARNTGIVKAKGDLIAFQDSDDIWHNDKLEKQITAIKRYNADICICQMMRYGFEKGKDGVYPDVTDGIICYRKLISSFLVSTQTIVAQRSVFSKHLFDPEVKRMQDFDWIVRAGKEHNVCVVSQPLVDVYLSSDSITTTNYEKLKESYNFFLKKYEYLENNYPELSILINKCLAYALTMNGENAAVIYLDLYKKTKQRNYFIKSIMARLKVLRMYYIKVS